MSNIIIDKKLTPKQRKELVQKLGKFNIESAKEVGLHLFKGHMFDKK